MAFMAAAGVITAGGAMASAGSILTAASATALGSGGFSPATACACARSTSALTTSTDQARTTNNGNPDCVSDRGFLAALFVDERDGIRNAGARSAVAVGLVAAVGQSE